MFLAVSIALGVVVAGFMLWALILGVTTAIATGISNMPGAIESDSKEGGEHRFVFIGVILFIYLIVVSIVS